MRCVGGWISGVCLAVASRDGCARHLRLELGISMAISFKIERYSPLEIRRCENGSRMLVMPCGNISGVGVVIISEDFRNWCSSQVSECWLHRRSVGLNTG
jgi:hypothetical protein